MWEENLVTSYFSYPFPWPLSLNYLWLHLSHWLVRYGETIIWFRYFPPLFFGLLYILQGRMDWISCDCNVKVRWLQANRNTWPNYQLSRAFLHPLPPLKEKRYLKLLFWWVCIWCVEWRILSVLPLTQWPSINICCHWHSCDCVLRVVGHHQSKSQHKYLLAYSFYHSELNLADIFPICFLNFLSDSILWQMLSDQRIDLVLASRFWSRCL